MSRWANVGAAADAAGLIAVLRERAGATEQLGRLPDATVDQLAELNFLTMFKPRAHGGEQLDFREGIAIIHTLARGDASAAWVVAVMAGNSFAAPLFYQQLALDDIYGQPGGRITSVVNVQKFVAHPVEGGLLIEEGVWGFNSGFYHSQWDSLLATLPGADGTPSPGMVLVPTSQVEPLNDWNPMGLRATGSTTVRVRDLFVPAHRITPISIGPGSVASPHDDHPLYRIPPGMVGSYLLLAAMIGGARGAFEQYVEKLPSRRILYTKYTNQNEAAVTHLRVGEAGAKLDVAETLLDRAVQHIEAAAAQRRELDLTERAQLRGEMVMAARMAIEAVDMIGSDAGGSFTALSNGLNLAWRNVRSAGQHAVLHAPTAFEACGRIACGLNPENASV